jgi:hypothetical protein
MENISHRIKLIADNEGIKITQLESKIGASKGVLSRSLANNTDIQSKWATLIVENYPQYNAEWLLTGRGSMLKGPVSAEPAPAPVTTTIKEAACPLCAQKDKLIAQLERVIARNEKEIDWLRHQIDCQEEPKTKRNSA